MEFNHHSEFKVFSGNANKPLALEICKFLGIELGKAGLFLTPQSS